MLRPSDPAAFVRSVQDGSTALLPLLRVEPALLDDLRRDALALIAENEPRHDETENGEPLTVYGGWRIFGLYNSTGRFDDIDEDRAHSEEKRFHATRYAALRSFFESFEDLNFFNLGCAGPQSRMVTHRERIDDATSSPRHLSWGGRSFRLRLHLPLITSPRAYSMLAGRRYRLDPGVIYFYNTTIPHCSGNSGPEERLHLVFDAWLTPWLWDAVLDPDGTTPLAPGLRRLSIVEREALAASSRSASEESSDAAV